MKQVEFYFDLGSPYSYLGFYQIQKIAKTKSSTSDLEADLAWWHF